MNRLIIGPAVLAACGNFDHTLHVRCSPCEILINKKISIIFQMLLQLKGLKITKHQPFFKWN